MQFANEYTPIYKGSLEGVLTLAIKVCQLTITR